VYSITQAEFESGKERLWFYGYRGLGLDSQPLSTADTTFISYIYRRQY